MPQLGHGPGLLASTSGHMGQTYFVSEIALDAETEICTIEPVAAAFGTEDVPSMTNPAVGFAFRYTCGSFRNFCAHKAQQK